MADGALICMRRNGEMEKSRNEKAKLSQNFFF